MLDMRTSIAKHTRGFGLLIAGLLVLALLVEVMG